MITEIFVQGKRLDINADISSLLTFAIDDVKEFASRQTTFSKTVVIPGTANNNAIFGNIFELGQANPYYPNTDNIGYNFNAAKSASCIIFQDNLQTFKGSMRLLEIDKDRERIEYEVALNGDLTTLNVALSSGYLSDLDFSAYDTTYDATAITNSWDAAPGSGLYFPLIDYGSYSVGKHNWDIRTFRPALYVKEYIDKMFAAAGFRYTCDLFNTTRFKKLIIPHNQKKLSKKGTLLALAKTTTGYSIDIAAHSGTGIPLTYDSFTGTDFSLISSQDIQYNAATPIFVNLTVIVKGTYHGNAIEISLFQNNPSVLPILLQTLSLPTDEPGPGVIDVLFNVSGVSIVTNTQFEVSIASNVAFDYDDAFVDISEASVLVSAPASTTINVNPGDTILINDSIPQNVRQIDFLMGIVQLFNLYVYEDRFDERMILISPFVDFYSTDSSNAVDWTYKLNRNKPLKIKPLSELNSKIYNFNYKDDSDYFNDLYKKRYNEGYGSYTFDSEFEFASQKSKLEIIFASSPLVGYAGEEKIYSTIFKRSGSASSPVEETVDSVIRIMQTKKITGVASWDIKAGPADAGTVLASLTSYGYAGHLDDPDAPTNDLNFGVLHELFFTLTTGDLTKTQFNLYWSSYMAEITDKDSKLLTAKFYLTPKDIFDLDFSKYVYLDGVLFRLNKITDYNATIPSDCEVQLLKVINTIY